MSTLFSLAVLLLIVAAVSRLRAALRQFQECADALRGPAFEEPEPPSAAEPLPANVLRWQTKRS